MHEETLRGCIALPRSSVAPARRRTPASHSRQELCVTTKVLHFCHEANEPPSLFRRLGLTVNTRSAIIMRVHTYNQTSTKTIKCYDLKAIQLRAVQGARKGHPLFARPRVVSAPKREHCS